MVDEPRFQVSSDRLPPQNIEAEESILGGILLDPEALGRVADLLRPEVFSIESHQTIYRAAIALQSQGKPTDLMTLTSWLADRDLLDRVGGQMKLAQLVDRTVSAVNIDQYAVLVLDKYVRRKLITAGHEVIQLGYQTATELETVLDRAEQIIFNLTQTRPQQGLIPISDTLIQTFADIESHNQGTALPGIPCGFYDMDAMTGGFQRSDLVIVAGRPSMGKCCAFNTLILQADGSLETIQEIYQKRSSQLLTLGQDWKFKITQPSHFVDDGIKPVFRVTTKLGRFIETTVTHPYLTINGWQPLRQLKPGDKIAVPRQLDVFGTQVIPEYQVKLLAYFLGDGGLTHSIPQFTNINPQIQVDFINAANCFSGVKVTKTLSENRATSFSVAKDFNQILIYRKAFAERLQTIIPSKFSSARQFAQQLKVSPALITHWTQSKSAPNSENFKNLCHLLEVSSESLVPEGISAISKNSKSSLTLWLQELGLWGKDAHHKTIPNLVFKLPKSLLSLFINRLFATDGWATLLKSGQSQLGYCTVSETLARQIQHLLLRFGIIASLKQKTVQYKNNPRLAWQLNITDAQSIQRFINEIGIWGKEEALAKIKEALSQKRYQTNRDLIPKEIWEHLDKIRQNESWSALAKRAGIQGYSNIHVGKRCLSRQRLCKLAIALDNLPLQQLANSEVYWDEIVSIEFVGDKQVYDLTIPETHNFVANDVCVHNTSFALNIANNIADGQGLPVAIFSLEMSKEQLVQRLLSSEAKIESNRLRSGRLSQVEWEPLSHALGTLSQLPIYIDDTANITVGQMRSQARRLQAEQGQMLGLILIDYLQLMEGGSDNRVQELSKITRQLKGLARELSVPIIALSQLSRGVEARTNKRPMMSDLRESGSIEQDADLVIMLYRDEYYNPDTPDRGIAEAIIAKHRNGPTGIVKLLFDSEFTQFRNLAKPNRY